MRQILVLLLFAVFAQAHASEIGNKQALYRSSDIVEAIAKGEKLYAAAIKYDDAVGFMRDVTGPLTRRLQWWREYENENQADFEPYRSCLDAGVAFNRYGSATWDPPSLARDREMKQSRERYKAELARCRTVIASGRAALHL